jgi:hypothetical protein
LEDAGFSYDSTFGYNDAVGYRAGTAQAYKPLSANHLMELPLHIQDTALFYSGRMNLSEKQAADLFKRFLDNSMSYGGVLTILWHNRSLAPERLWGEFYKRILEELRGKRVWFATAGQVVKWFRKRRSLSFDDVLCTESRLILRIKEENGGKGSPEIPALTVRIYFPKIPGAMVTEPPQYSRSYVDIPWRGEEVVEVPFSPAVT